MKLLFWSSVAALLWAYVVYPAAILARARWSGPRRCAAGRSGLPTVTVVLAVRNGAEELVSRVENLLALDYPHGRLDVIVACNGCTDGSDQVASDLAERSVGRVRSLRSPTEQGKAGALNAGAAAATGEVLVFADVRQRFDRRAVRRLVRELRDPSVGGVTGRLLIGGSDAPVVAAVGRYWQLESALRYAEGRTGSVVGATGAIHAIRRDLFEPLPAGIILDDVYTPLAAIRRGYRITMSPRAIAYDRPSAGYAQEYRRRVRTLVGNYEILSYMPWLLSPRRNPIFARFLSHKLLRLLTPLFSLVVMVTGLLIGGLAYRALALALLALLLLGALGTVTRLRFLAMPSAFFLLYAAGFSALLRPRRRAAELWQ